MYPSSGSTLFVSPSRPDIIFCLVVLVINVMRLIYKIVLVGDITLIADALGRVRVHPYCLIVIDRSLRWIACICVLFEALLYV